jgi:hypothetical protein
LIITESEIDDLLHRARRAVDSVTVAMKNEGGLPAVSRSRRGVVFRESLDGLGSVPVPFVVLALATRAVCETEIARDSRANTATKPAGRNRA